MQQTIGSLNHYTTDGEVKLTFHRPPDIKLSNAPRIVFAIPVGAKPLNKHFLCDKAAGGCGAEWMDTPSASTPNMVPVQFMFAYHNLQMPLNVTTTFLVESGRLSSEARQLMTKRAMRMDAKYIVYWDDDVLPPADAVYRLYNFMERNPEVGIAGGVCTTRVEPVEPVVYKAHGAGAHWDFECGPQAIPEPVFGIGAAFMFARVSAIVDIVEKLKAENGGNEVPIWADERAIMAHDDPNGELKQRGIFWGHDLRFCRLMQETGYHVVVHGAVLCGHLDSQTNRVYEMPADAPGFKKVQERLNAEAIARSQEGQEGDAGVPGGGPALGVEARTASH